MDAPNSKIWKHPYGRRRRGETFTDSAWLNALAEEMVSVNCLNCIGESLHPVFESGSHFQQQYYDIIR
jgi:hypothetical protein